MKMINLHLSTFYRLLVLNDDAQVDINLGGRKQLVLLHTLFWEAWIFFPLTILLTAAGFFMDNENNFEQIIYRNVFLSFFSFQKWTMNLVNNYFLFHAEMDIHFCMLLMKRMQWLLRIQKFCLDPVDKLLMIECATGFTFPGTNKWSWVRHTNCSSFAQL